MLGRVLAVNSCSPAPRGRSASFAPAPLQPVRRFTSVLVGGIGTIAVALLWMKLFPELRRIDTIQGKPD